jgi:hypothetical protein
LIEKQRTRYAALSFGFRRDNERTGAVLPRDCVVYCGQNFRRNDRVKPVLRFFALQIDVDSTKNCLFFAATHQLRTFFVKNYANVFNRKTTAMLNALRLSRYAGDLVFRRTSGGDALLNVQPSPLSVAQYRMLVSLNGKRTVDVIARVFRTGEPLRLLQELQSMGLVESMGNAAPLQTVQARNDGQTRPALSSQQFLVTRAATAQAATELLGATARPLVRGLEQCRDSGALREVVDIVIERLQRVLGTDAVAIFIDSVRRAAAKA